METIELKHDLVSVEKQLKSLDKMFSQIIDLNPVPKILIDIKKPGWTTIAELELFNALLGNLITQTKLMQETQKALLNGSRAILKS